MQPDDPGEVAINADEPVSREPEHAALVAIGSSLILTIFKFLLASLTGSLALLAEAFHSFSDIGSSLMVFLVLRAERVNDRRPRSIFSRLLGRNPQRIAALLIGFFLLGVAGSIFAKVFNPAPLNLAYPVPVALALLVMALPSFLLSRFEQFVGEKHDSTALVADGLHSRVDTFGTLLVSLALLGESLSLAVDRLAAGVISFLILAQAIQVFVTVARDYVRKEQKELCLYPRWILGLSRGTYPRVRKYLYDWVGARIRIAPDHPELDRQVGRVLLAAGAVILVAGYLATGLFKVEAYQQAIVERFGRPLEPHALGPGLHYRLPWPVDRAMKRILWVAIGLIATGIVIALITFNVTEGECALVTQFGRPVRTIESPGLNFKWPVPIQTVNRLDRRLQLFESRLVEFLTKDKKNVVLKFFVLWKLNKPKEFFLSVGNTITAEQKLDDILISKGGAAVGDYEFEDLISTEAESEIGELEKRIRTDLEAQTLRDYGYGIQKVGISRLALPEANAGSVFNRMRAERKAIANKYRAEGEQQAAGIRAKADREKSDLISEASRQAQVIRGKGEAEAAKVYAEAFKQDPEFYQFWRTLDSYRSILDSNTTLVLSEDSELFKYLRR